MGSVCRLLALVILARAAGAEEGVFSLRLDGKPVDHLCGARELRVLSAPADENIRFRARVRIPRIAEPSRLAELRVLRHLDLKYADGLGDLSFLASMPHLVRLEVSGTRVPALPDVALPELRVLRALARIHPKDGALSHPRAVNRHLTLIELEKIGTGTAAALIGARFREQIVPRPLPEPEEHEPVAWTCRVVFVRGSDRARAALALARLGQREYFAEIEKLFAKAVGEDRSLLSLAVTHLRNR